MRIERETKGGRALHYVVHTRDPKFSVELALDPEAPDKIGRGVIKRICVPNSAVGDYSQCAKFLSAAQEFFHESFGVPAPKSEVRRFHA